MLTKRRDSKGRPRRSLGKNCPVDIILCESPGLQMSLRASAHTGVAIRFPSLPLWGGAPRSESKSNNCQWQLLHNVKVARASPASARRMRALPLPMGEVPLEGAERACLPSQSLCDSSPKVGAKEKRIVTGGNPWKGPHQCEHWFAMTCVYFGAEKAGGRWPPLHCGFLYLPMLRNSAGSTGVSFFVTPKWTWLPRVLSTNAVSEA